MSGIHDIARKAQVKDTEVQSVFAAVLELVNGFDESFLGWGHEDSDLVVRLFNAGVMRKDGAFATEVFHLWHREAQRDQESSNRRVVLARAADKPRGFARALKATIADGRYGLISTDM